jgi:hypothetical protein
MITPNAHGGVPRPPGSEYLHRDIWTEYAKDKTCTWSVSVVRTPGGEVIEAHPAVGSTRVAFGLEGHSFLEPIWEAVQPLLASDEGWTRKTVQPCRVKGCDNGRPMWAARGDTRDAECSSCAARTVVSCVECGMPDLAHYIQRERMLTRSMCFHCNHWTEQLDDLPEVITEEFHIYGIGRGGGPSSCKGFGGARWTVTFHDGRVVKTDDLWSGSTVPEWFRDRFTPNATVRSGWEDT